MAQFISFGLNKENMESVTINKDKIISIEKRKNGLATILLMDGIKYSTEIEYEIFLSYNEIIIEDKKL